MAFKLYQIVNNCVIADAVIKDFNIGTIYMPDVTTNTRTFKNTKFMFTGDSQSSNEAAMIANGYDLSADVLKVGHHGSRTSTSNEFLSKVNPKYAVISCGKNNDYGHPHAETMQRLQAKGVKVYRTDEEGTIVCTSDGNIISFGCNPGDYAAAIKQ